MIRARSLFLSMGWSMRNSFACSSVSSNRFGLLPSGTAICVTSSSRIASSGGLDTCAKSCLKYAYSGCGLSDSTANGASLPMDPCGWCAVTPIGDTNIWTSSWEYPKAIWRVVIVGWSTSGMNVGSSRSSRVILFFSSHSPYFCDVASLSITSVGSTIRF